VLTASPAINHLTGASFVVPALASIRSAQNDDPWLYGNAIARGSFAAGLLGLYLVTKI
jgi:hypothetical protein